MKRKREFRSRVQLRAATIDGQPGVTLHAIRPGVVDDYGSLWLADTFDEALAQRLPTLCWSHDWTEPLGPAVAFRAGADGPEIDFVFSDFEAVPQARRAHAQVLDGTIRDCSVGFANAKRRDPTPEERTRHPGIREVIERADLDEVSLVLRGAVPGAKVVAARGAKVELDAVVELGRRVVAGELTEDEAKAALDLLGEGDDDPAAAGGGEAGGEAPPVESPVQGDGLADAEAAADEAMAALGRSMIGEWRFADRMTNDVRDLLDAALTTRHQPEAGQWVWVRDFSDVEVVYYREGFGDDGAFALSYTFVNGALVLGDVERAVATKTVYVPR